MSKPFIEARGVRMNFGSTLALENIDLTVREHEFFTIVGPSGCGKSTLLLLTAGLLKPSAGTLLMEGRSVRGAYTNAGIAFQHHNLLEWRSVIRNVLLPLEIRRIETEQYLAACWNGAQSSAMSCCRSKSGGLRRSNILLAQKTC